MNVTLIAFDADAVRLGLVMPAAHFPWRQRWADKKTQGQCNHVPMLYSWSPRPAIRVSPDKWIRFALITF
jgi:hypothetical protein